MLPFAPAAWLFLRLLCFFFFKKNNNTIVCDTIIVHGCHLFVSRLWVTHSMRWIGFMKGHMHEYLNIVGNEIKDLLPSSVLLDNRNSTMSPAFTRILYKTPAVRLPDAFPLNIDLPWKTPSHCGFCLMKWTLAAFFLLLNDPTWA